MGAAVLDSSYPCPILSEEQSLELASGPHDKHKLFHIIPKTKTTPPL
jgi:hypothetical protein